ncbi:hypothetical protein Moror_6240, partial [Moniliophthora roreri MCA 2997]
MGSELKPEHGVSPLSQGSITCENGPGARGLNSNLSPIVAPLVSAPQISLSTFNHALRRCSSEDGIIVWDVWVADGFKAIRFAPEYGFKPQAPTHVSSLDVLTQVTAHLTSLTSLLSQGCCVKGSSRVLFLTYYLLTHQPYPSCMRAILSILAGIDADAIDRCVDACLDSHLPGLLEYVLELCFHV